MIDIIQIRKYDCVMEELDPSLIDNELDEEIPELEVIQEEEEEERGFNCLWDEMDEKGNDIPCLLNIIPNTDGTMPDFCPKHTEEHQNWLDILELYIMDILKVCDPILIKKMNKDQSGWKKNVEEQLGLTKYMIKKFVEDKNKDGITTKDIAIELDNINE